MPFRALEKLADILAQRGHVVLVVAEGTSTEAWEKTKHTIVRKGEVDPTRPLYNTNEIFVGLSPDLVVVGLSSPINNEDHFASEANKRRIPVVAFSDTWGATSRMKLGVPNLILTMDDLDAKTAERHFPASRIVPVGDWMTKPVAIPRSPWTPGMKSIFIAGQNPATIKDFVVETLAQIDSRKSEWEVAFRPHPKYKGAPETLGALELLRKSGVKIIENDEVSGDELAATADITVSSFSGVLRVSALAGKVAVSVQTPNCIAQMEKSTALRTYPLVELGVCVKLDAGSLIDFGDLLREENEVRARRKKVGKYRESILPHPERAIQEILRLMGIE